MTEKDNTSQRYVSIVIPVYNGANYLRDAIDSALRQSYPDCEVIVINDGSTDNDATRSIAMRFGDRIKYIEKSNGGVATALNLGIRKARGDYISWLSHDDMYYPDKIEKQIRYINAIGTDDVIMYSDYEIIDMAQNTLQTFAIHQLKPYDYLQNMMLILFGSAMHGCTLLLPRRCFEEVGYFDEGLRTTQDYALWFRLLKSKYRFEHIPEVLVRGRRHDKQVGVLQRSLHLEEICLLHKWASKEFYNDIVSFPSGVVFNIIACDNASFKIGTKYLIDRIRMERRMLYVKLAVRNAWAIVIRWLRFPLAPLLRRRMSIAP